MHESTRSKLQAAQEKSAKYYNQGRVRTAFQMGDLVWRKTNVLSDADRGIAASLVTPFEGPFVLSHKISENVFELADADGQFAGRRNVDQLIRFIAPPDWSLTGQGDEPVNDFPGAPTDHEPPRETELTEESQLRPARQRRIPAHLGDYVLSSNIITCLSFFCPQDHETPDIQCVEGTPSNLGVREGAKATHHAGDGPEGAAGSPPAAVRSSEPFRGCGGPTRRGETPSHQRCPTATSTRQGRHSAARSGPTHVTPRGPNITNERLQNSADEMRRLKCTIC